MARQGGKDRGITWKDGKWWARPYINGREKWISCDSKSQAKAMYGRLKAEAREGKYFPKEKSLPFSLLAGQYETDVDATRHGKAGDDRARIRTWIGVFKDQDSKTITPEQVQRAITDMQAKGYKPATVHRYFTVLKAILNRVTELKLVRAEVCQHVRLPKYDNQIVRYLDDDQEAILLEFLPERLHSIVRTAINTGLRQGELLRLTWKDIDWQSGTITVLKTKSGRVHRIPMNSIVQEELAKLQMLKRSSNSDRLFPFDARNLRRAFDVAIERADLAPFRFTICGIPLHLALPCKEKMTEHNGTWRMAVPPNAESLCSPSPCASLECRGTIDTEP
jgi:Phage integrase family